MNRSRISIVLALTTCVLGLAVFLQMRTAREQKAEAGRLRAQLAEVDSLRAENERLKQAQVDPAELKRLRESQAELLRLRGQAGQLRREAQEAKATATRATQVAPAPTQTATQPTNDLPVETFTAKVTAKVSWGMAAVTGGWRLPSGKRGFVLVQPLDPGDGTITIKSQVIEVPENALSTLGLDVVKADGNSGTSASLFSEELVRNLVKHLRTTEGVEVLGTPQVTTANGRQAQVQAVEIHTLPSGLAIATGPIIDVTPTFSADKQSVELVVGAQLNLRREQK